VDLQKSLAEWEAALGKSLDTRPNETRTASTSQDSLRTAFSNSTNQALAAAAASMTERHEEEDDAGRPMSSTSAGNSGTPMRPRSAAAGRRTPSAASDASHSGRRKTSNGSLLSHSNQSSSCPTAAETLSSPPASTNQSVRLTSILQDDGAGSAGECRVTDVSAQLRLAANAQ